MASYQTIKNWPQADRPREKLLAQGSRVLSEAELLGDHFTQRQCEYR